MAYSEVENVTGTAGDFTVTVRRKARFVDEEACTGCGACTEKCPSTVPDLFNETHGDRKAVYSWFAQGIPSTHTLDPDHCRVLNGKKCGICQKMCQAGAIDFQQKDRVLELSVGAVVVATGYDVFEPKGMPEYRYNEIPNVVTAMEFERFLSASGPTHGHLDRPSDTLVKKRIAEMEKRKTKSAKGLARLEKKLEGTSEENYLAWKEGRIEEGDKDRVQWAEKYAAHLTITAPLETLKQKAELFTTAKRLAFIQCVGSRDLRFYPFCSGYCCMHAIKEAIIAHEHDRDTTSVIFGMDIRAVGKGFEEYKVRGGNNSNISYLRGRVAEIEPGENDNPVVVYEDTAKQLVKTEEFDLVVLSTACAPTAGVKKLADTLSIEIDAFGFFKTDSKKPLDTTREGVFVCGCAHGPMDIPESVAQASSAASRAVQTVVGLTAKAS